MLVVKVNINGYDRYSSDAVNFVNKSELKGEGFISHRQAQIATRKLEKKLSDALIDERTRITTFSEPEIIVI